MCVNKTSSLKRQTKKMSTTQKSMTNKLYIFTAIQHCGRNGVMCPKFYISFGTSSQNARQKVLSEFDRIASADLQPHQFKLSRDLLEHCPYKVVEGDVIMRQEPNIELDYPKTTADQKNILDRYDSDIFEDVFTWY